jgi:hypothetical protein
MPIVAVLLKRRQRKLSLNNTRVTVKTGVLMAGRITSTQIPSRRTAFLSARVPT